MEIVFKQQQYERIGTLPLDEVFAHIESRLHDYKKKGKVDIRQFNVNVQSLRLRTFYHSGVNCPCCETVASFFAVERNSQQGGYHLNLYGIDKDNKEILFTHDHKLARALGGLDDLTNTETMCGPCNWQKGMLEQQLCNAIYNNDKEKIKEYQEKIDVYKPQNQQIKRKI